MQRKKLIFWVLYLVLIIMVFSSVEAFLHLFKQGYSTSPFERLRYLPSYYKDADGFLNKYYPSSPIYPPQKQFKNIFLAQKPPSSIRLFILGGSTAQGFPYDANVAWSKIIQAALEQSGRYSQVEVINLGFSALSSYYVADVAKKLLRYQPDAIIIYSGHNEYYGTITSLKRPRWIQKLYLALKEWRIFQLAFAFFETKPQKNDTSLMAQQFAQQRIPYNLQRDEQIASHFIQNIDEVVRFFQKHHIPVFVVEPVANLIDMPPFGSENEEEIRLLISRYSNLFTPQFIGSTNAYTTILQLEHKYPSNAHILYLKGISLLKQGQNTLALSEFEKAKDYDTVPFRARNTLLKALENYARQQKDNPFFVFIPLQKEIMSTLGTNALGNKLFIDHLHFNREGQVFLSTVFCKYFASYFHFSPTEYQSLISTFTNENFLARQLGWHFWFDFIASQRIASLQQNPPYATMLLPYHSSFPTNNFPLSRYRFLTLSTDENEDVKNLLIFHATNNERELLFSLVTGIFQSQPAHPQSHYNFALILSSSNSFSEDAAHYWITAILLSEKTNKQINSNAISYFHLHHQEKLLQQILP